MSCRFCEAARRALAAAMHETQTQGDHPMRYNAIVISSGHGKYVAGASGILGDEVTEARKVVDRVAAELADRGVAVKVFHDNTSHDQNTNLETIVAYHNAHIRDLDVSVHFNAYVETTGPRGTEVLYVTQAELAADVSAAIAACGFIDRGAKEDDRGLYFLNHTEMPAILIEVCFVDSVADADAYHSQFDEICIAIADTLAGTAAEAPDEPDEPEPGGRALASARQGELVRRPGRRGRGAR